MARLTCAPPSHPPMLTPNTEEMLELAAGVTVTPFFEGEYPPPNALREGLGRRRLSATTTATAKSNTSEGIQAATEAAVVEAVRQLSVNGSKEANGSPTKAIPNAQDGLQTSLDSSDDVDPFDPTVPEPSTTRYRPGTECVFIEPETGIRDNYNASSVPIYQTATFKQSAASEMGEYDYSRSGNPTRTHVEAHLAKLMGAKRAFVVSSGMSALDTICRLVNAGDEIISGDDLYGGTNRLLNFLQTHNNVKVHHVDTTSLSCISGRLSSKTRLVLLETPTNPLIKIADVPQIASLVHAANPDALVVVDNTMMSPYLQKPLLQGADIVYHSGTKYLSGHHDLMAGVVGIKDETLAAKIYFIINATGVGLSPFDAFLLLRGTKTLALRMDKQQSSALTIATHLEKHHNLRVRYPGLASHPQYELHRTLARGPGAVLSFETGDVRRSERVVEACRLWTISVSFGCVNSLISMPCKMSHASIPAHVRAERAMPEDLIRLCVGIEDVEDLLEDLDAALVAAGV
ncbi:Cys/Met metabolism PLP-dependent enzyme-domain-containing protein [Fimicolochytrium jonesii]|uniref:Cys/Met metabolism PLP-dependent enzyme-domain-containing protein n=1 Tax=Fimicolochytrium jonesii TaxID=1396493 RepID=UPI0022FEB12F|nr:Cys/Met metabolism PLP-dependent enzyme-domain-containing protein [Fimicolochytrium jonesii]KAI8820834.1 Cys/Met metabolism PLP-dependent enzyme-domain-containing protein [Fimicolochytrium jonesii]